MKGSWCQPRRSLQSKEGKMAELLTPDRDLDLLLRLAEGSGVLGANRAEGQD